MWAAAIPPSQGIFLDFYPPHMGMGLPILCFRMSPRVFASLCLSVSPPLLPVWMSVASLIPWLLDFYIVKFSGGSG